MTVLRSAASEAGQRLVPDRNGREFNEAWAAMLTASDYDRLTASLAHAR
jgi:hypothetical protein